MPIQEQSQFSVSWPGLIALLVAVVGLFLSRPSLVSPRPTTAGGEGKDIAPDNSVPARLWQDPLAAALRGQQAGGDMASVVNGYILSGEDKNKQVLFLFDCIPSGNTAEDSETRRRERYAILSALGTAGYAPLQADRIHYADVTPYSKCRKAAGKRAEDDVSIQLDLQVNRWSMLSSWWRSADDVRIPYEWVGALPTETAEAKRDPKYRAVCVLWVNLLPHPYQQLCFLRQLQLQLIQQCSKNCLPYKSAIAGRIGSTSLTAMLEEDVNFTDSCGAGIPLYVTWSTSPSARKRLSQKAKGLKLECFIETDDRLVKALIQELRLRHVDPDDGDKNPIAVVAERDTDYGMEMHDLFQKHVKGTGYHYSYLRGLDGKVLGKSIEKQNGDVSAETSNNLTGGPRPEPGKPTAQDGEGESQIDYVSRLAERMKADLRADDKEDFKSIAIVGSDVYDKLLLLKALRPSFPNAVFCTTDLDVRLTQRGDYADTRNLVIASPYSISLRKELQGKVAPFRSSYDTASYLACLRAVDYKPLESYVDILRSDEDGAEGFKVVPKQGSVEYGMPVHIYEMSLNKGAYELTLFTQDEDTVGQPNPRLHPWLTRNLMNPLMLLLIALGVVALLSPVSRPLQRFLSWNSSPVWIRRLILAAILVSGILGYLIYRAHTSREEENFQIFEGISVWPTVILHLLACCLCVYYIGKSCQDFGKRNAEIRRDFYLPDLTPNFPGLWNAHRELWDSWFQEPPQNVNVSQLHEEFLKRGAFWKRAFRTGILAVINMLLYYWTWQLLKPDVIQARGGIAYSCHLILLVLTLIAFTALLMFVVDSTWLSYRFVDAVKHRTPGDWPAEAVDQEVAKWGLPLARHPSASAMIQAASYHSLFIRYLDEMTRAVTKMINYPFVVLLVLIVAQNRLFDDWHWNLPLAIIVLSSAGVAVACGVMLQLEAKGAQSESLKALDDLLRSWVGPVTGAVPEKLAEIRTEIKHFRTGAFAGFSQNPIVKAVLLPLLGGGGLAALEALLPYFHTYFQ